MEHGLLPGRPGADRRHGPRHLLQQRGGVLRDPGGVIDAAGSVAPPLPQRAAHRLRPGHGHDLRPAGPRAEIRARTGRRRGPLQPRKKAPDRHGAGGPGQRRRRLDRGPGCDRRVGHCGGRPPEADRPLWGGGRPRGPGGRNPPRDRDHPHPGRQLGRRGRADDRADAGARAADLHGEPRRAGRPVAPHRGGGPGRQDRGPGGVRGRRPRDGAATGGVRVPGPRRGPLREPGGDCGVRCRPGRPRRAAAVFGRRLPARARPPPRPRAW